MQVEVEVPGTPEQVWEAIATGPGVSSWFVPTEVREDGTVVCHLGPDMDAVATQTAWEPLVEWTGEGKHLSELLLLDQPAPGIVFLNACEMGRLVYLGMSFYLYGDRGPAPAARDEPSWHKWMNEQFPAAGNASSVA